MSHEKPIHAITNILINRFNIRFDNPHQYEFSVQILNYILKFIFTHLLSLLENVRIRR